MANQKRKSRSIKKGYIVAIDGPSGAGKSTVSQQLAEALEGMLLDTGGMYRGVAYYAVREGVSRPAELKGLAGRLDFDVDKNSKTLLINSVDLGQRLRTEDVSHRASEISQFKGVREVLTRCQRQLAKKWARHFPVVVEGRDIGTVVFPNVPFKFFVTASAEVRAKRRLAQLRKQGVRGLTVKKIMKQNEIRDEQDSSRKIAPLRMADDAVVVDTSSMAIGAVVRFMHDHIRGRLGLEALTE